MKPVRPALTVVLDTVRRWALELSGEKVSRQKGNSHFAFVSTLLNNLVISVSYLYFFTFIWIDFVVARNSGE
jgi:hypothetical protein